MPSPQEPPPIPEISMSNFPSTSSAAIPLPRIHHILDIPSSAISRRLLSPNLLGDIPTSSNIGPQIEPRLSSLAVDTEPSLPGDFKDRGCSSTLHSRSSSRYKQITPRTDKLTSPSTVSPVLSSVGSSEAGHSLCSFSSDDFLPPPQFENQDDNENPPYKPRQLRTGSLTMMNLLKYNTINKGKSRKLRRKHRRDRHWKRKVTIFQNREEVVPLRDEQIHPIGHGPQEQGLNDIIDGPTPAIVAEDMSNITDNPAVCSRIDTEAGMGLSLVSSLKSRSSSNSLVFEPTSTTNGADMPKSDGPQKGHLFPSSSDPPRRRAMPTDTAKDDDIIGKLRKRLTNRKIHVDLPQYITLRRATASSDIEIAGQQDSSSGPKTNSGALEYQRLPGFQRALETYLITREDIDSITHLVLATLKRSSEVKDCLHVEAIPADSEMKRKLSFTQEGLVLGTSSSTNTALTKPEVETALVKPKATNLLVANRAISLPASPTKSMHELIWQDNGSAHVSSPNVCEDNRSSSTSVESSCSQMTDSDDSQTYIQQAPHHQGMSDEVKDEQIQYGQDTANLVTLDSTTASAPIDFSEMKSNNGTFSSEISNEDSRSLSNRKKSNSNIQEVHHVPLSSASSFQSLNPKVERLDDVVSFPPLPKRSTVDWQSPLPPLNPPSLVISRSSNDLSLGGNRSQADSNASDQTLIPNSQRRPSNHIGNKPAAISRASSLKLDHSNETRRRSIVKTHPKAAPRIGSSFATGFSLGTSSRERRKSSYKEVSSVKWVQTIDNKHKGERQGTWSRARPPSVCPPPKTPTPPELTLVEEGQSSNGEGLIAIQSDDSILERLRLLRSRGPRSPAIDHVGIHGRMTGTKRPDGSGVCQPHVCDDREMDPRNPSIDWIG